MSHLFSRLMIGLAGTLALMPWLMAPAPAAAACAALPAAKGTVTVSVGAPTATSYRVWSRILATTAAAKSFYLQISDGNLCQAAVGGNALTLNTWTWVDYQNATASNKVNVTLTGGNHSVVLAGLDDGLEVDRVLLLTDTTCTPTGDGSNCLQSAATPTPTGSSAVPGSGTSGGGGTSTPVKVPLTSSGTPTQVSSTIAVPTLGLANAKCTVDGKDVDCAAIDTKKLAEGQHTVAVIGTDSNGKTVAKTTTIEVENHKTLPDKLLAGLKRYPAPAALLALIILGAPLVVWYDNRRTHFLRRLTSRRGPHASTLDVPASSGGGPAPADIVYPSKPDPK